MNTRLLNFIQENKILSFSFIFFALFSTSLHVFATPPTSPYGAGDTLDPSCAPGDTYCYVGGITFFENDTSFNTLGYNTFAGINAGNRTMGSSATADWNASWNTAFGANNQSTVTNGGSNTSLGAYTLNSITTQNDNVAVGVHALVDLSAGGGGNTVVGKGAYFSLVDGDQNVGLGLYAGLYKESGDYNTAIGTASLWDNDDGTGNTALGLGALGIGDTGDYNIGIGYQAGEQDYSGDKNIAIGYKSEWALDGGSNQLSIGNLIYGTSLNGTEKTVSTGKIGIRNNAPAYTLHVGESAVSGIVARFENSTGTCDINPTTTSLSCSSDETLKTNIETLELDALEIMNSLRPVTYNWKTQADQESIPGFIAQEIETQLPKLVNTDPETGLKSLNYTLFTPYIIKSIQELDTKVSNLMNNLDFTTSLKSWLASATNGIETLVARVIQTDRIETDQLCIERSNGSLFCINGDQLEAIVNSGDMIYNYSTAEELEDEETILEEEVIEEETSEEEETIEEDTLEEVTEEEEVLTEEETPVEEVIKEDITEEEVVEEQTL